MLRDTQSHSCHSPYVTVTLLRGEASTFAAASQCSIPSLFLKPVSLVFLTDIPIKKSSIYLTWIKSAGGEREYVLQRVSAAEQQQERKDQRKI